MNDKTFPYGVSEVRVWAVERVLASCLQGGHLFTEDEAIRAVRAASVLERYCLSGCIVPSWLDGGAAADLGPNHGEATGVKSKQIVSANSAVVLSPGEDGSFSEKHVVHERIRDRFGAVASDVVDAYGHSETPSVDSNTPMVAEAGRGGNAAPAERPATRATRASRKRASAEKPAPSA